MLVSRQNQSSVVEESDSPNAAAKMMITMVNTTETMTLNSAPSPAIFALFGLVWIHTRKSISPTRGTRNPSIAHPKLPESFGSAGGLGLGL